jgi:hypothetical protein
VRDPKSKPTIIDEDGEQVVDDTTTRGAAGRTGSPFGQAGFGAPGFDAPGFDAAGIPPIPERLLNKHGKPSLFKMIGWKGAVVLALVVAGIVALAAVSFMVLLFVLPVLLLLAVVGWVVGKVRGPQAPAGPAAPSIVVVRRRI